MTQFIAGIRIMSKIFVIIRCVNYAHHKKFMLWQCSNIMNIIESPDTVEHSLNIQTNKQYISIIWLLKCIRRICQRKKTAEKRMNAFKLLWCISKKKCQWNYSSLPIPHCPLCWYKMHEFPSNYQTKSYDRFIFYHVAAQFIVVI